MKETAMKFLTWISGGLTIASLLHWIPIIFGAGGAVLWFGVAYYKFTQGRIDKHKSALDDQKSAIELQIAELHLKHLKDKS